MSAAILERAGAKAAFPTMLATPSLQIVGSISWGEAKSVTTTNSAGAALLSVPKQTSTGLAITTTPVTQLRVSL